MKNFKKRDIAYLWIIILSFLALVFILSNTMYLYGSQLDWYSEHISIPEYFRTLFYHTKDLFPDFAMNIGNGQNIYNLSYYGFLSPIILISYFLPKVSMTTFIIVSTILCVLISAYLLYAFLKSKNISSEACFISVFMFVASLPISLHSHRHIMFINYMPFLILGLFGVDKKLKENKGWLLALSVFLTIMTSYFYSVGGIVVLIVYGIYVYLKSVKVVTLKSFFKTGINFILPIFIGVLLGSIMILPTFASLLNNRADSNTSISILKLLIPNINLNNIMFSAYGIGLTAIIFPAIVNIFKKKKENIFIGIVLSLILIFPLFNYILNGTMYIDSKSLIPFLPLYIMIIALFIDNIFNKKINYKILIPSLIIITLLAFTKSTNYKYYLLEIIFIIITMLIYKKINKKIIIVLPFIILAIIPCISINKTDTLVLKYTAKENEQIIKDAINTITDEDKEFYRISNNFDVSETVDKTYNNINYYNSTIYSSISNQTYNSFYFDTMNNNIPSRNRALTVTTQNLLSLMLSNNKYLITRNKPLQGYELISVDNGLAIYKNENVLPLGFATNQVISYSDFEKMNYAVKQEALLNLIVADTKTNNSFQAYTTKVELPIDEILTHKNITKEENGSYTINSSDQFKIKYTLPTELQNKIIFIQFKMNNNPSNKDLSIKINNTKNKLTSSKWKYHNGNNIFTFVVAEQDLKELTISFTKGEFNISDFEIYSLDYAGIENSKNKLDEFIVNKDKTKGDKIYGTINVTNDESYMMLTIPYDKGFNIKIDGNKVDYEKVDDSFIGFKIEKGEHNIEIEYKAPLKEVSLVLTILGLITYIIVTYLESKRKIS